MGKRRFLKRKAANEEMVLQITSMADIFTILLVFLLKSFSTGISTISPTADMVLPEAKAGDEVKESLKLEIASGSILIDDKPITQLLNFKFVATDLEKDGTPRSLNAALIAQRSRQPASVKPDASANSQTAPGVAQATMLGTRLMVLADQKTPYSTLKAVMAAAGNSGFVDLKLVVVEDK